MANQFINKVIYGGNVLIDITDTNINPQLVLKSKTSTPNKFHMADGSTTTGACTFDADTSNGTALASEILSSKIAYVNGVELTGTMSNIGVTTLVISTTNGVTIPQGYHDGSGYAVIDSTEAAKITPENIKYGVSILGVIGDLTGDELVSVTTLSATPKTTSQTYIPSAYSDTTGNPYDYFSQFTVAAIPYTEADNAAGGKTVTIAGN